MKKVTIAIPIYNDEKYIARAIESAINQDYEDLEILIIDDCSTDNTLNILKDYLDKDDRIRIIRNDENKGIGYNRNECIRNAKGDYLCFLSSDDYYKKNYVSTMINVNKDGRFCFCSYDVVDENDNFVFEFKVPRGLGSTELRVHAWASALKNTMFCNYSTVFASLDFWKENMFDESYRRCEDLEHFLNIMLVKKLKYGIVNKSLVCYRIFPDMGTNRVLNEIPQINAKTIGKIKERLK